MVEASERVKKLRELADMIEARDIAEATGIDTLNHVSAIGFIDGGVISVPCDLSPVIRQFLTGLYNNQIRLAEAELFWNDGIKHPEPYRTGI